MKTLLLTTCCALSMYVSAQTVTPFKDPATGGYGFKDASGNTVVPPKYQFIGTPFDQFFRVELNGQTGLVDRNGKEVVPPKYFSIDKFSEGLAVARKGNENYGYIDTAGNEVVPLTFRSARDFKNGFGIVALADSKNKWKAGFVDKTGKVVVPVKYDRLNDFSEGLSLFELGSKRGFVDQTGKEVFITGKYDDISSLSHNRSVVSRKNKYGYIDREGKEVIPIKYDMAEHFDEQARGKVKVSQQYFFVDTLGNLVKGNAGFYIDAKVNVAKDHWVVVTSKALEAKEPVYFLTASRKGAPFAAAITWQIIDAQNNVIKEGRTSLGYSFSFRVPADGVYTVQAYYDMKDCTGCSSADKPGAFTMAYTFNTRL